MKTSISSEQARAARPEDECPRIEKGDFHVEQDEHDRDHEKLDREPLVRQIEKGDAALVGLELAAGRSFGPRNAEQKEDHGGDAHRRSHEHQDGNVVPAPCRPRLLLPKRADFFISYEESQRAGGYAAIPSAGNPFDLDPRAAMESSAKIRGRGRSDLLDPVGLVPAYQAAATVGRSSSGLLPSSRPRPRRRRRFDRSERGTPRLGAGAEVLRLAPTRERGARSAPGCAGPSPTDATHVAFVDADGQHAPGGSAGASRRGARRVAVRDRVEDEPAGRRFPPSAIARTRSAAGS